MSALEKRISAALAADTTSGELATLVQEIEAGIVAAEQTASSERERAFDPARSPDPGEARKAMEDAIFAANRLRTLLPRLKTRYQEVAAKERLAQWQLDFAAREVKRDALVEKIAAVYPAAVRQLTDLFGEIAAQEAELSRVHESRPAGVSQHLNSAELEARALEAFSRDRPSLLKLVRLFDFDTGKQTWPPLQPRDMSIFAPLAYDARHSPDWWKVCEERAAAVEQEQQRVAEYCAEQAREREKRERAGK